MFLILRYEYALFVNVISYDIIWGFWDHLGQIIFYEVIMRHIR